MSLRLERTAIEGVLTVHSEPVGDERGTFMRTFSVSALEELGLPSRIEQASVSNNHAAGTLRGMHWQEEPHAEAKLIRCSRGEIFDVLADIRPDSPTYGEWLGWTLDPEQPLMLWAGPGIAHGFQTLTDGAQVSYLISAAYEPEAARGARWDDPLLAIDWPTPPAGGLVMSERDRGFPPLPARS